MNELPNSDPLDLPIPCDLNDGQVTIKKGDKLRAVLTRLKWLSGLCRANLPKAYQYDVEHPNDGLNAPADGRPVMSSAKVARDALELIANTGMDARQCMETATRALSILDARQTGENE